MCDNIPMPPIFMRYNSAFVADWHIRAHTSAMSFVFPDTLPSTSFPTGEIAGFFPITGVYFGLNDALAPLVFFLHFVEFQNFDMFMEMIAVLHQCIFFGPWVKLSLLNTSGYARLNHPKMWKGIARDHSNN